MWHKEVRWHPLAHPVYQPCQGFSWVGFDLGTRDLDIFPRGICQYQFCPRPATRMIVHHFTVPPSWFPLSSSVLPGISVLKKIPNSADRPSWSSRPVFWSFPPEPVLWRPTMLQPYVKCGSWTGLGPAQAWPHWTYWIYVAFHNLLDDMCCSYSPQRSGARTNFNMLPYALSGHNREFWIGTWTPNWMVLLQQNCTSRPLSHTNTSDLHYCLLTPKGLEQFTTRLEWRWQATTASTKQDPLVYRGPTNHVFCLVAVGTVELFASPSAVSPFSVSLMWA